MVARDQYDWLDANSLPVWAAVAERGAEGCYNTQLPAVLPGFSLPEIQNQIYNLRRFGLVAINRLDGEKRNHVALSESSKLEEALTAYPLHRLAYWAAVAGQRYQLPPLQGLIALWAQRVTILKYQVKGHQADFSWLRDRSVGPVAVVLAADEALTAKEVAELSRESKTPAFLAGAAEYKMLKRFRQRGSGYHYLGLWRSEYAAAEPVLHWALLVLMARERAELPQDAPGWARASLPGFASYMTEQFLKR